jgi:peptide/nickel transport system substrate-binding protein
VVTSPVGGYEALYVNIHGNPPYDLGRDDAIRRALAYAIDRADIATNVWQGTAEPSWTIVPSAILGASASLVRETPFDTARASAILDSAGWRRGTDGIRVKGGRRLTLTMVVGFPSPDVHTPMPEIVQAQLRRVGIELRIARTPDNASYQARVRTGDGDLWAEAGGQNDGNPCFLPDLLFYSGGSSVSPSSYARLFAPGPQLDRFVEACRSAVEPQDVQRDAAEAMRVLVDEEFVVIPLAGTYRVWGLSDAVRGFTPHPSSLSQRWDDVWLER